MVAFRKLFPALAVAGLMLGSFATQATAQVNPLTCTANAGVPPLVRAEGLTELVGDIVLICTGGSDTNNFLANFQVFLNTNITSRLISSGGQSEALLMLDEPTAPGGAAALVPNVNVFYGQKGLGENTVTWLGVPIQAPGTTRTIRITNIRANAALLGTSNTLIPTQIVAFISISASTSIAVNNPQQTVAFIQPGISFAVRNCNDSGTGSTTFFQCNAQNGTTFGNGTSGSIPQFGLKYTEGFATAFKRQIDPGNTTVTPPLPPQATSIPGIVYNSESGFVNPALNPAVGLATTGTRLSARFANVPAGVRLFVSDSAVAALSGSATAVLIATSGNGDSGSAGSQISGTTTMTCDKGVSPFPSSSGAEVSLTNGAGAAIWEVTGSNPSVVDSLFFQVAVAYSPNTANNLPAVGGQATVTGGFAPFYGATSGAGVASSSLPIPRFTDAGTANNLFTIAACSTNLLFPFVTNQAGFDTGIAISNTSRDPFANPANRLQAGTCILNYFGTTTGGGAAPAAQTTNANVDAGAQLTFVVSTGGNLGIAGTPGFQGYIIAQCNFQYAHGFAFITDGPIGQARVAEGYLGLVLDAAIPSRGTQSEVLGN